jgi:hypothetical protein
MNRRKAIKLKCLDCSGYEYKEVKNSGHKDDCSLYPYRFGKGAQNPKERDKAIRAYCVWCMVGQIGEIPRCGDTNCALYHYRVYNLDVNRPELGKKHHRRAFVGMIFPR